MAKWTKINGIYVSDDNVKNDEWPIQGPAEKVVFALLNPKCKAVWSEEDEPIRTEPDVVVISVCAPIGTNHCAMKGAAAQFLTFGKETNPTPETLYEQEIIISTGAAMAMAQCIKEKIPVTMTCETPEGNVLYQFSVLIAEAKFLNQEDGGIQAQLRFKHP